MLKGVTVMLVTYSWWRWCWWASFDVGEIFWMLVPDVNIEKGCMLVAKMVKTVINIVELSPTHFVFNIRHQHQCNRWQRQQYVGDFIMLIDLKCWQNYFFQCKESVINILNLSTIHFISNIDVTVKLALRFFFRWTSFLVFRILFNILSWDTHKKTKTWLYETNFWFL